MKHLSNPFSSSTEEAMRKSLFLATDEIIQKHNSDPTQTFLMRHNKFSIMVISKLCNYSRPCNSNRIIEIMFIINRLMERKSNTGDTFRLLPTTRNQVITNLIIVVLIILSM